MKNGPWLATFFRWLRRGGFDGFATGWNPLPNTSAPTHPPRPVLGHGRGDGFPAGFRFAELAALALRVHRKRADARPSGQHPSHSLGLRLETATRSPHGPLTLLSSSRECFSLIRPIPWTIDGLVS